MRPDASASGSPSGEPDPPSPDEATGPLPLQPRHGETIATLMHAAAARSVVDSLKSCIVSVPTGHLVSSGDGVLANASEKSIESLRRCITEYAHTMRALGEPETRVLVMLEAVVNNALPTWLNVDAFRYFAIQWCIETMRVPA
jgi:hypothetical protein